MVDQNKRDALTRIARYRSSHKPVYMSFEKNALYDWSIRNAYESVLRSSDSPLNTLDRLIEKYDGWIHRDSAHANGSKQHEHFSIALSAIDDLIDMLLSN